MPDEPVTTLHVRGQDYPVKLVTNRDRTSADFLVDVDNLYVRADTLAGVRERLMRETKKRSVKVEVPYTTPQGQDGVATGIHAATGKVLVRETDAHGRTRSAQLDSLFLRVFRPLTDAEKAELHSLQETKRKAENALADFTKDREVYLPNLVRDALNAAADKPEEA